MKQEFENSCYFNQQYHMITKQLQRKDNKAIEKKRTAGAPNKKKTKKTLPGQQKLLTV